MAERAKRRRIDPVWWIAGAMALLALVLALYILLPWLSFLAAWHEAVRRLGPLDPADFARRRPPAEANAEPLFIAAGRQLALGSADEEMLRRLAEGGPRSGDVDWQS